MSPAAECEAEDPAVDGVLEELCSDTGEDVGREYTSKQIRGQECSREYVCP